MDVRLSKKALGELEYWKKTNPKIYKKILVMIDDTTTNPFGGKYKPEALQYNLSGYWSKRITQQHRLVYRVVDDVLWVEQCRYHY